MKRIFTRFPATSAETHAVKSGPQQQSKNEKCQKTSQKKASLFFQFPANHNHQTAQIPHLRSHSPQSLPYLNPQSFWPIGHFSYGNKSACVRSATFLADRTKKLRSAGWRGGR
jgi:hypothetical protein